MARLKLAALEDDKPVKDYVRTVGKRASGPRGIR